MAYLDMDARREYVREYKKTTYKQWKIDLHRTDDADIIEFLGQQENKQAYVKELIRKDMKKHRRD